MSAAPRAGLPASRCRFSRGALPAAPWKNGGGTTQQIASWPAGAALDDLDWRLSIATIAAPGPFSVFAGMDRHIMMLDGAGVLLRGADGQLLHRLDQPYQPFAFAGDAAVDCSLLGGPCQDLNVMTRRGRWRADLQVCDGAAAFDVAPHGMLLALRGAWRANELLCPEGEGVCWFDEMQAWQVVPIGADARLAMVRIVAPA